jgi:hypothetical protein
MDYMTYTALVLDAASKAKLLAYFDKVVPLEWDRVCHHMTINLGGAENGPAAHLVGQEAELKVVTMAQDNRVFAVGVESDVPSKNAKKHVTVAVNVSGGGKAKYSNDLTEWVPLIEPFTLRGVVTVVDSSGSHS